jgi:hypothetical protein
MVFWQFWEVAFQAFMILIGVGIIWLKFIEPLFPSHQISVPLMIVVAVALAAVRIAWGTRTILKQRRAARAQIASLNGKA